MDLMADMPDNYIDLAIVDPPYGIGGDSVHTDRPLKGAGKLKNIALNKFQTKWDIAPDHNYFNKLFRISKNQIIWGGNYFNLGRTRGFIFWDKIQYFKNFSAGEFAWTSFERPAALFRFDNKYSGKIHPTQKPIALYRWLLQNYAKPGQLILDTHSGSGSCAIACMLEGFDFIAIEKDKDYWKASVDRFNTEKSQLKLF
jgi:site-specific DNA-methyltransferase (adenine-specific)